MVSRVVIFFVLIFGIGFFRSLYIIFRFFGLNLRVVWWSNICGWVCVCVCEVDERGKKCVIKSDGR